jgi:hypothetical protein
MAFNDFEFGIAVQRDFLPRDAFHDRKRRSVSFQRTDESLQQINFPFGFNDHTLRVIENETCQAQSVRQSPDERAKPDPLHYAGDFDFPSLFHGHFSPLELR